MLKSFFDRGRERIAGWRNAVVPRRSALLTRREECWVLVAIVVMLLLVAIGMFSDLSKQDWASWVQAIGSILAISAAAFAVHVQLRHTQVNRERADHQRDFALTQSACHFGLHVLEYAIFIHGRFDGQRSEGRKARFPVERVAALQDVLTAYLSKDLPPVVVMPMTQILKEVTYLRAALRQVNEAPTVVTQSRVDKSRIRVESIQAAVEQLAAAVRSYGGQSGSQLAPPSTSLDDEI